ncbi:MAG: GspH/FimT family pseudopilin [Kistimonas sp.]|nr:GspH/FimT family pseudopilin [Kistimonas sp.]
MTDIRSGARMPLSLCRHKMRGFTLVELLVVMLIVGLIAGLVVLAPLVGGPARQLGAELDRLHQLVEQARDRALLDGRELGLSLSGDSGYEWWQWSEDTGEWRPLQEVGFRTYRLPAAMVIVSVSNSGDAVLSTQGDAAGPQWVFYTDTTVTPFHLELSLRDENAQTAGLRTDGVATAERL